MSLFLFSIYNISKHFNKSNGKGATAMLEGVGNTYMATHAHMHPPTHTHTCAHTCTHMHTYHALPS